MASGERLRCTPPTTAASHSPARIAVTAWCSAASEDAHAESIAILGPLKSKDWLIVAAVMLSSEPGSVNGRTGGTSQVRSFRSADVPRPYAPEASARLRSLRTDPVPVVRSRTPM